MASLGKGSCEEDERGKGARGGVEGERVGEIGEEVYMWLFCSNAPPPPTPCGSLLSEQRKREGEDEGGRGKEERGRGGHWTSATSPSSL
eukprot:307076-Rhodomonas_salina.2